MKIFTIKKFMGKNAVTLVLSIIGGSIGFVSTSYLEKLLIAAGIILEYKLMKLKMKF